jgi:membrane protein implicated in regulation of membrane protease activity
MAAFVAAFGAFGLIFSQFEATKSPVVSSLLSIVCAVLVAATLVSLLRKLVYAADSSSESQVAKLIGQAATVITPIPAGGVGEIAYVQAGTRYTAPAREESGVLVGSGSEVKITRVVGSQFFVALRIAQKSL